MHNLLCDVNNMKNSKDDIAKRLKEGRILAGFKTASEAAESLGVAYPTYAGHENGSRGVEREAAQLYARRFKMSLDYLLTGRGPPTGAKGTRHVTVAAHVEAGAWAESWEWPHEDQYTVYIPDDREWKGFTLYGAETRGPSMNKRYPERTVLVFNDVSETQEEPIPGKRYIVERRRASGETEHTVKTLYRDQEGKFWLIPESDDPRYQSPISIEEGTGDEDVVAIIGRVLFSVTRE